MNSDIRLSVDFWDHPKTIKLERRLGVEGVKALLVLWCWAAVARPDGVMAGMDVEGIEIAAKWDGEEGALVETFIALAWLDVTESGYALHDWLTWQPWASKAEERSEKARFSRMASTYAELHRQLKAAGYDRISREEYDALTTRQRIVGGFLQDVEANDNVASTPCSIPHTPYPMLHAPTQEKSGLEMSPESSPESEKQGSSGFQTNGDEVRLSKLLFSLIQKRNPKHKVPNFQKWALHVDRLIRLDNRTPDEIEQVIMWAQGHDFWHRNILSTEKLRKQFDKLWVESRAERQAPSLSVAHASSIWPEPGKNRWADEQFSEVGNE